MNEFLTIQQLANHFGVCKATIHNWRRKGELPKSIKIGRVRLWAVSEIESLERRLQA